MEVKDLLKMKRLEKGLTMKELADMVGVSEGTISRWESGLIANMRRDKIVALAKALGLTPGMIMGYEILMEQKLDKNYEKYSKQLKITEQICRDGAEVIFEAYELAPDKMTDYARMICLTSGDRRHLATAAHTDADRIPQEDLDQLDD